MKNNNIVMKNIKLTVTSLLIATFFGCSNSDYYTTPDLSGTCNDLTPTKTVPTVLALVNDNLQQFDATYDNDIIEAYVTSSDEGGNFFKSISLVSVELKDLAFLLMLIIYTQNLNLEEKFLLN
jgi:hypothetical protein